MRIEIKSFVFVFLLLGLITVHFVQLPKPLLPENFQKSVIVEGVIANIPKRNALGSRFLVNIKRLNDQAHRGKLLLAWYQSNKIVHAGERWRWQVKLKPIHGLQNPAGFKFKRWAKQQHILATGYVQPKKAKRLSHSNYSINLYREHIQNKIDRSLRFSKLVGVIVALSIGSKHLLSPETQLVFQRTGTSHLMAISGLHVGLVVAITYFIFNYLMRCFPHLLLKLPAQHWARIASLIAAWSYGSLVGFSLPTQRAVIMMTILILSHFFSQTMRISQRLLWAFIFILALQPLAIYSMSFWLSFLAVFWLAYAVFAQKRGLSVKFVLILGLLPITLYDFHQVSFIALFANLVAIPWVTILIVPLCLLASVLFLFSTHLAIWIWCLSVKCFYPLWLFLQLLSKIPLWLHPINDFFVMLCALLGICLLVAPRGLPCRALGFALLLPLLFSSPARPKLNQIFFTVLDVGQGLSSVIQTAHHVLVYDTGPRFPTGFDAGRSVLMPFLRSRGLRKIDTLVVSHGDNDHIGGSFWLVRHIPVAKIFSSIPRSRWPHHFQPCFAGQAWQWDGVQFQMLWPPQQVKYADNNNSCVLRVSIGKHAILLTGDIEKPTEEKLVAQQSLLLRSDILLVPHHGSRSSSTPAFVKAVHPSSVIISVGYRNRYHFPAQSVVKRYRASGAQIFSTSVGGAVSVVLGFSGGIRDNGRLIDKIRLFHEPTD